jgi:hypothetical protein
MGSTLGVRWKFKNFAQREGAYSQRCAEENVSACPLPPNYSTEGTTAFLKKIKVIGMPIYYWVLCYDSYSHDKEIDRTSTHNNDS